MKTPTENEPPPSSPLQAEVKERFGVLPNFFQLAPSTPEITENLWGFARFAYLDNPLPSLFKERLFVYLSRFCDVRYCIVRHLGFLIGLGRPAGDRHSPTQSVEQVIRLLRRPLPRGEAMSEHRARVDSAEPGRFPEPESALEEAFFACATHVFLQTDDAPRGLDALRRAMHGTDFQHLLVFLAFVRTAHYWTQIQTDLRLEADVEELLATHMRLAEVLCNDPEAKDDDISRSLLEELETLRGEKQRADEMLRSHEEQRQADERALHHASSALAGRLDELSDANKQLTESRRAALNLMEDAIESREALRGSEDRFRTLADAVPEVIWANDAEGRATYFNGRWFEYSGLSLEQSTEVGWQAIVHPDDAPASKEKWQHALAAGEAFDTEYRLRRADGAYRWHIGRNVPLKDEAGRVLGWFGSATDIEDLFHARSEAQAANAAKDHFLAVLSHELRTPLTPITMALHSLSRREDLPAPVQKAHAMIKRNVELEAHFIDEMLDMTRISRGKMEIARQGMDLHEAAQRAVEVSSPDLEAKGQSLTVSLDAGQHRVNGDFARLQQAMWNLLKNAAKFTPKDGAISLRTRNEPGQVIVEVTDTGIGMEAEAIARIFRPFEQADASITRLFGGLGLGLAIAKGTAEAHGGELRASSPGTGQGATFTLSLPLS